MGRLRAQTVGRRDLPFWTDLARRTEGTVLELECGTGRVSLPVGKGVGARLATVFEVTDRNCRTILE